jgi:anti-sigma regulatory factor (Ser/Thr protein kinase)
MTTAHLPSRSTATTPAEDGLTHVTRLRVAASPADMAAARDAVARALGGGGWADAAPRVLLAAGEALANALVHGSDPGAEVQVTVLVNGERVIVRVRDRGRSGEGERASSTAPVSSVPPCLPTGGRGRVLMRAMADVFETRRLTRGTEVRLDFLSSCEMAA